MPAALRARLLGRFDLVIDGRSVDRAAFERPSGIRLLKLLLATPGHRVRREAAAELLWPEMDPDRSAANLRKALHFARRALARNDLEGDVLVRGDLDWLDLGPDLDLDLDVDRLQDALDAARAPEDGFHAASLAVLAELGGEELLPEDPYEEWLVPLRERLRQQTLEGLRRGAGAARAAGHAELAFRLIDRTLALDPAEEAAHRLAIELYLDSGQLHAARRQLLACTRALAETYGVEPSPELAALIDVATSARGDVPRRFDEPPIVGRRVELEAAEPALDAVTAGRLGAAVYRGAAGIGKTRVLRELTRVARATGWLIIEARGLESSPDLAFGGLGTGLATALDGRLPEGLQEPGRSAVLAISPAFAETPTVAFASDEALLAGLVDAFRNLAGARPLVLAVDDVQWLDRPTLELLDRSLIGAAAVPLLLLGTVRDAPDPLPAPVVGFLGDVERAGGQVSRLGPVGPREVALILERDVAGQAIDRALAEAIARQAGGAPLFALEVLRSARDAGFVVERGGMWRLATPETSLPVPPGVGLIVERRTARLPAGVLRILTDAAELGDEVSLEQLVAAAGADMAGPPDESLRGPAVTKATAEVLDALDAGIEAGLLMERNGRYVFAHPLFRSALRGSVRPRARADLHVRVARALAAGIDAADHEAIERAAGMGRDVVGVAAHAVEAVDLGRPEAMPLAIAFGFAAGERQAGVFDHGAAAATLQRTLSLWDRLPPDEASAFRASAAYLQLGWSRHALGDEPAAVRAFQASAAAARDDGDRARGLQAAAWMPYQHGRFESAQAILDEALRQVDDPVARASIQSDLAWIDGRRGDWRTAYERLAQAVPVLEGSGRSELLARSLDRLAVAMRDSIDPDGSVPVFERASRIAEDIRDPRLGATIRMHLAGAYRQIGRLDAARREIDAALMTCAMTGDRYIEAVSVWIAADIAHAAGEYDQAIALRRRELEMLESLGGNDHNQAMAHAHLAYLGRLTGDRRLEQAEARIARLIAAHSGLPHLPVRIEQALASAAWFIEDPPGPRP